MLNGPESSARGSALGLLVLALLLPPAARAWPVDWVHDVEVGKEKFVRLPRVDWFEIEDPKLASVEWFPDGGELLVTGLKAGRTLLLIGAEGKVAVWRVRVGTRPVLDDKKLNGARDACPDFRATPDQDVKLAVTVKTEKCRLALLELFQTDAFEARAIELEFEGAVLQTQLKAVQAALTRIAAGRVTARYVGAGLALEGKGSQAEYRATLWAVLRATLGRFALDDQTEWEAPPNAPDAGPKPRE